MHLGWAVSRSLAGAQFGCSLSRLWFDLGDRILPKNPTKFLKLEKW